MRKLTSLFRTSNQGRASYDAEGIGKSEDKTSGNKHHDYWIQDVSLGFET